MNIGITGVTGLIGRRVAELARAGGHSVTAFTRKPSGDQRMFSTGSVPDFTGCQAIVNLAGESVVGLWTKAKRKAIRESRVLGTRRVVEGIQKAGENGPKVLISGSAIGYYGDTGETITDETGRSGGEAEFLAEVCQAWEAEARKAEEYGARVVLLRTGVVLARGGGALPAMLPIFRMGLGGKLGSGRQWMSWIHLEDEAALILAAIENTTYRGPVNATAPIPVRNAEFTRALGKALGRPAFFWAPGVALKMALGEFSKEVLESRRIVPRAAEKAGFAFKYPELPEALSDLLGH